VSYEFVSGTRRRTGEQVEGGSIVCMYICLSVKRYESIVSTALAILLLLGMVL